MTSVQYKFFFLWPPLTRCSVQTIHGISSPVMVTLSSPPLFVSWTLKCTKSWWVWVPDYWSLWKRITCARLLQLRNSLVPKPNYSRKYCGPSSAANSCVWDETRKRCRDPWNFCASASGDCCVCIQQMRQLSQLRITRPRKVLFLRVYVSIHKRSGYIFGSKCTICDRTQSALQYRGVFIKPSCISSPLYRFLTIRPSVTLICGTVSTPSVTEEILLEMILIVHCVFLFVAFCCCCWLRYSCDHCYFLLIGVGGRRFRLCLGKNQERKKVRKGANYLYSFTCHYLYGCKSRVKRDVQSQLLQ